MPTVIPVKFRYAARDLWFDPKDTGAVEADHVICSTERGIEIGLVTGDAREISEEDRRAMCGDAVLKPVLRVATDEDLDRADELAERGDESMPIFRRLVAESGLDMKPVSVEYLFGGEKTVCYFSADERVDFRQLVRDLARELHERIDMRQIGVREEAAIIGGYAHCGQELCCARFGNQFEPVSIRMAKEQDLPLNSSKISGACGRLMCCLRYEFEAYRDFKGRAPKRNAVIETPLGKGKIVEYDTPKEQLTLRLENGKMVRVALEDMEASEAAVRKSVELNCPCRPDTATREALERLATPEVQLALAELDREMGLVPEETYDSSDIFVEPPRSRRRRSSSAEKAEAKAETKTDAKAKAETKADASQPSATKSRRRRKKRAAEGEAAPEAAAPTAAARPSRRTHAADAEAAQTAAQPKSSRRRRHHTAGDGSAPKTQVEQQAEKQPRPSRRNRSVEGARKDAAAHAEESGAPARRPRRRPGDRGGQEARSQQVEAQQPKRAQQEAEEATSAKRRRRRRGGRGRGKGNAEGQASAE